MANIPDDIYTEPDFSADTLANLGPLAPLAGQVRTTVAATVERLLGLELGSVTVLVDGVGA